MNAGSGLARTLMRAQVSSYKKRSRSPRAVFEFPGWGISGHFDPFLASTPCPLVYVVTLALFDHHKEEWDLSRAVQSFSTPSVQKAPVGSACEKKHLV